MAPDVVAPGNLAGAGYPNLPLAYVVIAAHSLAQLPTGTNGLRGSWWNGGYGYNTNSDDNAPTSAAGVLQVALPAGLSGGRSAGKYGGWDGAGGEYRGMYAAFTFRIVGTSYENQPVATKLAEVGYGLPNAPGAANAQGYLIIKGTGSQTIESAFQLWFCQQDILNRNLVANVNTSNLLTAGPWHRIELLMTMNEIGVANGVLKLWIDGQLALSYSDVVYRTPSYPALFHAWKHDVVWGGIGGTRTRTDYFKFDHDYVAGLR